jgi:hypothetical protein
MPHTVANPMTEAAEKQTRIKVVLGQLHMPLFRRTSSTSLDLNSRMYYTSFDGVSATQPQHLCAKVVG